ncbi:adenine-specific DNA-methyltransferase [Tissierella praeacuta]|uniref:Eco57I restriction-modification methylase domain-containing protein n=1 Tax=Tissierella praeacuta TaxID=43131 RepID=UPI0010474B02|nr:N-6 DNA methylase [Tissierella praeacuta]TCU65640.1 adenine-specific DNA-methyltransferase [Tissierella praeacuta]
MKLKKDATEQKLRGAYYTPLQLSNAMVGFFVDDKNIKKVLEPSCGDGVFIDSIIQKEMLNTIECITAVEIERMEAEKVKDKYNKNNNISILNVDFFDFYKKNYTKEKYDLILGNPPYIRYQYLTEKQRNIQSEILISHGMKSNKLINSWVGFLVACVQMLNDDGKIAFVIPAEILQVAYAEDLRLFLSNQLAKITLITFEKLVFPEIEQEVLIFIGEKGIDEKGIKIIEVEDLDDLEKLDLSSNEFQEMEHTKEKWTKYFTTKDEMRLIKQIKNDSRFLRFSEYGIINIGITTGNNSFFSIDRDTEEKYGLTSVLLPLIGRSAHAQGIYFTENDWLENVNDGRKAQLLSFQDIPYKQYPKKHKEYIELGEKDGVNKGYKCSIRDRWYIVPSIWIPDAFFLRRNYLYPKFVLNKCNAVSTDTMHRIKFNEGVDKEVVLLSYYNSISFAFSEICGRSYGGGVLEILPGELGNIVLPRIESINSETKTYLLNEIDRIIRKDENIEKALDLVDNEILVNHLGLDIEICKSFRRIWTKLQKRRLGRS